MEPIFNANGAAIGWLKDSVVRNLGGTTVAWIDRETIYDLSGSGLGKFSTGFFRKDGEPFAFILGATAGPMLPLTENQPLQPLADLVPLRPLFAFPALPYLPSRSWSDRSPSDVVPGL